MGAEKSVYSQNTFRPFYNPYTRRWGTIYYPSQYLGQDNYPQSVNEGTVTRIDNQSFKHSVIQAIRSWYPESLGINFRLSE